MDAIITALSSTPIYLVILAILTILLIIAIVKKLSRLLITLALLFAIYAGYLYMTGQKIPTTDDIIKSGKEKIETIKENSKKVLKENVKKEIDKKLK